MMAHSLLGCGIVEKLDCVLHNRSSFRFHHADSDRFPAIATETTSVWQGVYTEEQAARGKARYFVACAACHGRLLQGDSDSPALAGTAFMKRWGDQPATALFAFATSQMPVGRPGSLGSQGYVDVIAFILATNGFPNGERELPANQQALESIMIEKKK